jgi:hypothetical protein
MPHDASGALTVRRQWRDLLCSAVPAMARGRWMTEGEGTAGTFRGDFGGPRCNKKGKGMSKRKSVLG